MGGGAVGLEGGLSWSRSGRSWAGGIRLAVGLSWWGEKQRRKEEKKKKRREKTTTGRAERVRPGLPTGPGEAGAVGGHGAEARSNGEATSA